jgi:hypothetical protein
VDEKQLNFLHDLAKQVGELLDCVQAGLPPEKEENLNRPKVHGPVHFRYVPCI